MATLDEMRRSLIAAHNSGDTITARKLALSIKLMESQPMGAVPVAQPLGYRSQAVRRPLTVGERVQEFGAGVGRGLETQLSGIRAIGERFSQLQQESAEQPGSPLQAMVFRPAAQLGREFLAGIEPYVRDPGKIVEAGQEMASRAASGPQQAGQVFGEMVDPRGLMAALKTPPVAEMTTYHGTPHVFAPEEGAPLGRFRASQIGTGEGAQAYGHGIYVAESPEVAGGYAYNLGYQAGNLPTINNKPATDLYSKIETRAASLPYEKASVEYEKLDLLERLMQQQATPRSVLADAESQGGISSQAIDWFKKEVAPNYKGPGSLYTVDLPDPMVERMLDWDKPLSEQPPEVASRLESLMRKDGWGQFMDAVKKYDAGDKKALKNAGYGIFDYPGSAGAIYKMLESDMGPAKASAMLRKAGIPGIRYLDAGSRDSAKGTRNFVIFPGEEQNLTILQRE